MQHIEILTIERFRAFKHFRIEGLGRVNLITGRNNTGKSSVLEALRLLASEASPSIILNILLSREEYTGEGTEYSRTSDTELGFPLSGLFHGFPQSFAKQEPIVISSNSGEHASRLKMDMGWYLEQHDAEGFRRLVLQPPGVYGEGEGLPGLIVETRGGRRVVPVEFILRRAQVTWPEAPDSVRLTCEYVSPYGGEQTATLGQLWDNIVLAGRESEVVKALSIIDPGISTVSMIGGQEGRKVRTAIVKTDRLPRPVPLRSFGDGLNRLFGIIIALVNAKGGLLLIDEFENGMHYSVQIDVWKAVFKLARQLNVQVMATSHSWDTVAAFQQAASDDPEEGVLVRLSRKGDDVIPTLFREDELAVATRDRIEVR
jgi:hypothetical protein